MKYSVVFSTLVFLFTAPAGRAEPGVVVSLATVAARVDAQNPELAAARYRIREAAARSQQAGRLDNPELETSLEHNPRFREWRAEIGLAQKFPVTARLNLERALSLTELRAAEAEVREVRRQLVADAKTAAVDVLAVRARRQALEQQRALSTSFAEFLARTATRGEASSLDAGQARIEAASLGTEIRLLDAEEAAALGKVKVLLGVPLSAPLHLSGALPAPAMPAAGTSDNRPDLQAKRLEAAAATQGVDLQRAKQREDLEAAVFAGVDRSEDAPDGHEREAIFGFRLRIPLPWWTNRRAVIEEARAKEDRVKQEATALDRRIQLESAAIRDEMKHLAGLVGELENTLLPLAARHAEDSEKAFRNGQGDLQSVFRSREKHLQLATTRLATLRQFHLAAIRYQASRGTL